jgi:hypothetical protein
MGVIKYKISRRVGTAHQLDLSIYSMDEIKLYLSSDNFQMPYQTVLCLEWSYGVILAISWPIPAKIKY